MNVCFAPINLDYAPFDSKPDSQRKSVHKESPELRRLGQKLVLKPNHPDNHFQKCSKTTKHKTEIIKYNTEMLIFSVPTYVINLCNPAHKLSRGHIGGQPPAARILSWRRGMLVKKKVKSGRKNQKEVNILKSLIKNTLLDT